MSGTIGRRGSADRRRRSGRHPGDRGDAKPRPVAAAAGSGTGADVVAAEDWREFRGQRVGVITNPTGVLSGSLVSIVDAMVAAGVKVGGVFGPEHGFRGAAQAGSSEDTYVDERTGVTVYDAYGADAAKFARFFAEAKVQTVIFDIQDVGARFYTYIWTMYDAMIAAGQLGLRFVILDRPNPVGGRARGPLLVDGFTSGVGQGRDRPAARDDRGRVRPLRQRRAAAGGRQGEGRATST